VRGPRRVALAAIAAAVASCAAPSRQLTTRIVEDPITLPRRMASISMNVTGIRYEPTDTQGTYWLPDFRLGITDRLEWVDLLGLRYAFLDDRPADGRAPDPVSLALRAGIIGIGYSSAEGTFLLPVASLRLLQHVGDRWAVSLAANWSAQWVAQPFPRTPAYNDILIYSARRFSFLSLEADVTRQLTDRVALGVGAFLEQGTDCVSPFCDWKSRTASVDVVLGARPLSWLTLSVAPAVGVRERPDIPLPTTYPDGSPVAIRPLSVTFASLTCRFAFYW